MKTHKDLDVWMKSMDLAEEIYRITDTFPDREKFSMVSQLRRAAISVPSNIAEGATRNHTKEFVQFLYISLGSTSELETQLLLAKRIGYISNDEKLMNDLNIVRKLLVGLINSVKQKQ